MSENVSASVDAMLVPRQHERPSDSAFSCRL